MPVRSRTWSGSSTDKIKLDDVNVASLASRGDVGGGWWDNVGDTAFNSGKIKFTRVGATTNNYVEKHAIRRGFRGDKFVLEYDHSTKTTGTWGGAMTSYLDNENWNGVVIKPDSDPESSNVTVSFVKRVGGVFSTVATSSSFSMTAGQRVRCAIHDDPNAISQWRANPHASKRVHARRAARGHHAGA